MLLTISMLYRENKIFPCIPCVSKAVLWCARVNFHPFHIDKNANRFTTLISYQPPTNIGQIHS